MRNVAVIMLAYSFALTSFTAHYALADGSKLVIPNDEIAWFGITNTELVTVNGAGLVTVRAITEKGVSASFQIDGLSREHPSLLLQESPLRLAAVQEDRNEERVAIFSIDGKRLLNMSLPDSTRGARLAGSIESNTVILSSVLSSCDIVMDTNNGRIRTTVEYDAIPLSGSVIFEKDSIRVQTASSGQISGFTFSGKQAWFSQGFAGETEVIFPQYSQKTVMVLCGGKKGLVGLTPRNGAEEWKITNVDSNNFVAASRDGKRVCMGVSSKLVFVDTASGARTQTDRPFLVPMEGDFSPDGTMIAVVSSLKLAEPTAKGELRRKRNTIEVISTVDGKPIEPVRAK